MVNLIIISASIVVSVLSITAMLVGVHRRSLRHALVESLLESDMDGDEIAAVLEAYDRRI